MRQLFVIITFLTRKENIGLLFHIVILRVHTFVTACYQENVCLQHRNMGCANDTTVRQPFALMHQFGICDHQDATAEGRKDEVTWCQDPTHPTDDSFVAPFWMGVSRAPSEQPRLRTVTLNSSFFDFS